MEGSYLLLRHRDFPGIKDLDEYRRLGGFQAFRRAVTSLKPAEVTEVVKASELRGRGGAGFPTGVKWSFIDNKAWPHYVVANADESEPGTFKDREIMEGNPFQFLEGVALAAYAIQANAAYIYLRGEFWHIAHQLDQRIADLEESGLLGDRLFGTDYSLRIYTGFVSPPTMVNREKPENRYRIFIANGRSGTGNRHCPLLGGNEMILEKLEKLKGFDEELPEFIPSGTFAVDNYTHHNQYYCNYSDNNEHRAV